MTETVWKDNNIKEGFTDKEKIDDMHTKNIINKLKKLKEKKKHENFANIKPLESIYDTLKPNKKEKKQSKDKSKPLREGLDNGLLNGVPPFGLDDDDYDGHDNVDDEKEDINPYKETLDALKIGVRAFFDFLELIFYSLSILIYLIFSGEGKAERYESIFAGYEWRSKFNKEEEEDIDLIFSYFSWSVCIMMSSILTYGLYLYMFYTESKPTGDDIKLNVPDEGNRASFCSWDYLTPFFTLDYNKFTQFYKDKIYQDLKVPGESGQFELLLATCTRAIWYFVFIIFQDSVFVISIINELLMVKIPNWVRISQKFVGENSIFKISNSFIFFLLALLCSSFLYSFGGSIKSLFVDGILGEFDFTSSGFIGMFIMLLIVVPSIFKYVMSFVETYDIFPPQKKSDGGLFGTKLFENFRDMSLDETKADLKSSDKATRDNAKNTVKTDDKKSLQEMALAAGKSYVDTNGYILLNFVEKTLWGVYSFNIALKFIYNFFRFVVGILFSTIIAPLYIILYVIVFIVINPFLALAGNYNRIINNIDTHRDLDEDEFYNLFFINSENGKKSNIEKGEIARVVEKRYSDGYIGMIEKCFDFLNNMMKNMFIPIFLLMFIFLLSYASADVGLNANNSTLRKSLTPILSAASGIVFVWYLYKLYKLSTLEGGRIKRFLRDFLGIKLEAGQEINEVEKIFIEAKNSYPFYEDERWKKVYDKFQELISNNKDYKDLKYEKQTEDKNIMGQKTENIRNMTIDYWKQGIYRYLLAKHHDYIPLLNIYKNASKEHSINVLFSKRDCAPQTKENK